MRAELGMVDEDAEEDELPRFHYPLSYLMQTWNMLHHHHILPRAGGWDDQCELWAEDINSLTARYNRMHALYAAQKQEHDETDDELLAAMSDSPQTGDFAARYGFGTCKEA